MGEGVEEIQQRADLDPQAFQDLDQARHVGAPVDAEMKVEIRLHCPVEVLRLLGGDEASVAACELGDGAAIDGGKRALRRQRLQLQADLAQLHVLGEAEAAHPQIVARLQLHGAIAHQLEDRLANRGFAHPKGLGEIADLEALLRLQLPAHQPLAELAIDGVAEAGARDRRQLCGLQGGERAHPNFAATAAKAPSVASSARSISASV